MTLELCVCVSHGSCVDGRVESLPYGVCVCVIYSQYLERKKHSSCYRLYPHICKLLKTKNNDTMQQRLIYFHLTNAV